MRGSSSASSSRMGASYGRSSRPASSASVRYGVADDAPERLHAVFPGNLLAFFVGAAGVADGYFVDAPVAFGDFRGDLRLKAEAVRLQAHALQHFPPEDLVTSLHVGELQICADIGEQREHL